MRPTLLLLKSVRVATPQAPLALYEFPALLAIKVSELVNNGFGVNNYHIKKTKYGHWPVYKKVQNTKITTEIKRLSGDLAQFKRDLIKAIGVPKEHVVVNHTAGYVNVKGDVVRQVTRAFDELRA